MNFSRLFKFRTYRDRAGKKTQEFFFSALRVCSPPRSIYKQRFPDAERGSGETVYLKENDALNKPKKRFVSSWVFQIDFSIGYSATASPWRPFSILEKSWHSLPRCFHKVFINHFVWVPQTLFTLLWKKNCLKSMFLDCFGIAFKLTWSRWEMLYLTSKDMVRTLLTKYFEPFRKAFLRMLLNSGFLLWAPLIWRKLVLGSNQRSPAYLSYPGRLSEPITRETKSWRG